MITSILDYLEGTTRLYPEKTAFADLDEEFTFKILENTSKRIGTYISERIPTHSPVVIYMEKKAYNISAFFGAVYAGCFYVPIDAQMPIDRVNLILHTLRPSLIMYDKTTAGKLGQIDDNISKVYYLDALSADINAGLLQEIRRHSKTTDLLYVLFTSGSTGTPKGVTLSHAAVIDFMEWICGRYSLNVDTVLCNQAPFYFDASVPDIYIPIKCGATTLVPPKSFYTFPNKILKFIEDKRVNTLIWVPSALCNVVNCRALELIKPKTIKLVIFCGEVMPCKHLNVWRHYVPDALYVNMYGPTEATYACMYYDIIKDFNDDDKLPLGRACENSEILLFNDDDMIAQEGEIGEICILGQCLSNGYYNAANKTASSFVQNPVNKDWLELMYRTGDLAYREGEEYYFAGRKDFQIKRLGHRIELGEIENNILSLEAVENACCVFNEETNEIVAIYSGLIDERNLCAVIERKLPHYMLPSSYIHLDSIPMNINGKIDRTLLKEQYARK